MPASAYCCTAQQLWLLAHACFVQLISFFHAGENDYCNFSFKADFIMAVFCWPLWISHLGGWFLKQHGLMVDPATCRLANGQGMILSTMAHPNLSLWWQDYIHNTTAHSQCPLHQHLQQQWVTEILAKLLLVVNVSKRLSAVSQKVLHHIVRTGPPIATKFCRLDGEKLEATKAEFKQLESDGIILRSTSSWAPLLCTWRRCIGRTCTHGMPTEHWDPNRMSTVTFRTCDIPTAN